MLPILYRDEHLVAIHKPSGLLVHRTNLARQDERFAVQMLRDQIGQRVYPAHRLDRGTSGVLLFGLSSEMAQALGQAFTERRVDKRYLAVVRGHPPEAGEIDHPLARIRDAYEDGNDDGGKGGEAQEAVTRYRRLATCELPYQVDRYPTSRYALLELDPLTGRRHQLRRHLKHISHPIIGDATYGKGRHNRLFQELFGSGRLLLACVEMAFAHPVSGERVVLKAEVEGEFLRVVEGVGWHVDADDVAATAHSISSS